jgi:hypothetical protein
MWNSQAHPLAVAPVVGGDVGERLGFATGEFGLGDDELQGLDDLVDLHSRELKAAGEPDEAIFMVGAWREAPYFSDAERAALALTEAATRQPAAQPKEPRGRAAARRRWSRSRWANSRPPATIPTVSFELTDFRAPPSLVVKLGTVESGRRRFRLSLKVRLMWESGMSPCLLVASKQGDPDGPWGSFVAGRQDRAWRGTVQVGLGS